MQKNGMFSRNSAYRFDRLLFFMLNFDKVALLSIPLSLPRVAAAFRKAKFVWSKVRVFSLCKQIFGFQIFGRNKLSSHRFNYNVWLQCITIRLNESYESLLIYAF